MFLFISLVVGLPYSSIFCQFWLFFVFKLLLSFFWFCNEAQCVYLCLHLGWKPNFLIVVFICISPMTSTAAASTPMGVFNQRFEALFPGAGALGFTVCFAPPSFLPVYLCTNVRQQGLPATTLWGLPVAAWPALLHNLPPHLVCQLSPCHESSPPRCPSPPLLPV